MAKKDKEKSAENAVVDEKNVSENKAEKKAEKADKAAEKKAEKKAEKTVKKTYRAKKLKFGSISAVVIVLVVAIVVVVNLMCGLMMKRYPIKVDLTPDNRHEISEQTIDVLKDIDKDVKITVTTNREYFNSMAAQYKNMFYQYYGVLVECPYDIIPDILDKYSVYAAGGKGSITVEYIDLNKNPDAVSRWSKYYSGDITEGGIVIQCGERVKYLGQNDIVNMITPAQNSTQDNIQMLFAGESVLTTAVKAVTDADPVRAAFVTKMNGTGIIDQTHASVAASLLNFLTKNGYECSEVDIASDDLSPENYDLVVLTAPGIDFTADIISKMSDFLYNNGGYQKNMIYIPNLYATNLPNISEFLADWKISVEPDFVFDNESMVQAMVSAFGTVTYAPTVNANSDISANLQNQSLPIVAPQAHPVSILSKNNESIADELVTTNSTAYLVSAEDGQEIDGSSGSYDIIVKSRKETANGLNVYKSNLLVIGSPFMLDSLILSSNTTYNNANAVINMVNDMTGKEAAVVIPEKAFGQYTLTLTTATARVIAITVIVVIPLVIAIAGFVVLMWRRNK